VFAEVPANTIVRFNLAYVVAEAEGISRDEAASRLSGEVNTWEDAAAVIQMYPAAFLSQQAKGILRSLIGVESGVWARQLGYGLERQGSLEVLSAFLQGGLPRGLQRARLLMGDPQTAVLLGLSVLAITHTALLYLLGAGGVLAAIRERRTIKIVYLVAGISAAFMVILPGAAGQARFRIPVEPYLALFAGAGLCLLVGSRRKSRIRGVARESSPEPQTAGIEG
jgi:hypothetical protein